MTSVFAALPFGQESGKEWRDRVADAVGAKRGDSLSQLSVLVRDAVAKEQASTPQRVRVGFIGAAGIARKTWAAIRAAGHVVTLVGCRDTARGQEFVDECQKDEPFDVPPHVGSYDDVINSADVDAIYVPIPVTKRLEWLKKAAAARKHIVCEKPVAPNLEELKEALDAAREAGIAFIDGTMLSHGVRIGSVATTVAEEAGTVRRMHAVFNFNGDADFLKNDIRMRPELEPHGALGDIGWYCIRYTLHLNKLEEPEKVEARIETRSDSGAIVSLSGRLEFRSGVIATFTCSFESANEQTFTVSGTSAVVTVYDFCLPFLGRSAGYTVTKNAIDNTGCGVLHTRNVAEVELAGEDDTFQETQLWRQLGFIAANPASPDAERLIKHWRHIAYVTQHTMERVHRAALKE